MTPLQVAGRPFSLLHVPMAQLSVLMLKIIHVIHKYIYNNSTPLFLFYLIPLHATQSYRQPLIYCRYNPTLYYRGPWSPVYTDKLKSMEPFITARYNPALYYRGPWSPVYTDKLKSMELLITARYNPALYYRGPWSPVYTDKLKSMELLITAHHCQVQPSLCRDPWNH